QTAVVSPIALSPAFLSFPGQLVGTTSTAQEVLLTNNSGATLTVSSLTVTGANAGDFNVSPNTCTPSVGIGGSCVINVTFKPTKVSSSIATLNVNDSATGSPQIVSLLGGGTDFVLGASRNGSTSATVPSGQMATFNLQATSFGGFS